MGLSSRIIVHARHRHGPDRVFDHQKAQTIQPRSGQRWTFAGLIALGLCASSVSAETLRIASYHTELRRDGPGLLLRDILSKEDPQVEAVIRVVRAADADVILLLGVDYDLGGVAVNALAGRIGGYETRFSQRPNRGLMTEWDLDGDGYLGGAGDAQGYATFSGQNGMAVLSKFPIATEQVRDFSAMAWVDLPKNSAPEGTPGTLRLSTTAHWDVPIVMENGKTVHLLAWHATPPVFAGRNKARNHDETAFWLRYLDGELDEAPPRTFVLMGDANLDPIDGDGQHEAISALLAHPLLRDPAPTSRGGAEAKGGVNDAQRGDPALDTADWEDVAGRPGNLRVDYVLPAAELKVINAGVLWPAPEQSLGRDVKAASRHRLVWVEIDIGDDQR